MKEQVYICNCKNDGKLEKEKINNLTKVLSTCDVDITQIEDICASVIENPKSLQNLFQNKKTTLFACEPRAMEWLLKYIDINKSDIDYHNINSFKLESVNTMFETGVSSQNTTINYVDKTKPWYPIIDFERCTHCLKCLNFCLFGVYTIDKNKKIAVENPMNCKDMCPACSRVCPEQAIIFPKHSDSSLSGKIIENIDEDSNLIEEMQNDDIYNVLEKRRKKLNTKLLKKNQVKIAKEERNSCSCKNIDDCC